MRFNFVNQFKYSPLGAGGNGGAKMMQGIVCENSRNGFVRVYFEADDIPTKWLPIVVPFAHGSKAHYKPAINTLVGCVMDEHCNDGFVVGALYNDEDTAPTGAGDNLIFELPGGLRFEIGEEFLMQKGNDTLKQILTLIIQANQQVFVLYGNNPDYTKLATALQKVNNLTK